VNDGTVREDFVQFIDAYGEAYCNWDSDEKSESVSSGTVLGDLVVKTVENLSLNPAYCVGTGTDACSVMMSVVCGAVSTIQCAMPRTIRCPCFSHALNLSISKSSSVQCVRNAIGTVKEVVSFFKASAKRNFVWKHVGHGQLTSLCERRWIERHDCILQFCCELTCIIVL